MANLLYEVRPSSGKGYGVFATSSIEPGTVIISDEAVAKTYCRMPYLSPSLVQDAFDELDPEQQEAFLKLHEGNRNLPSRLLRIYKANCFGHGDTRYVFLKISKINHSCVPNADFESDHNAGWGKVIAVKAIGCDEEITICYNDLLEGLTRAHRNAIFQAYYGFECSCVACRPENVTAGIASDMRRRLMNSLGRWAEGKPTLDTSAFDRMTAKNAERPEMMLQLSNKNNVKVKLSEAKLTLYWFLHAKLREAEGFMDAKLAYLYSSAADILRARIEPHEHLVTATSVLNVKAWKTRAIVVMRLVRGPEHTASKRLAEEWREVLNKDRKRLESSLIELTIDWAENAQRQGLMLTSKYAAGFYFHDFGGVVGLLPRYDISRTEAATWTKESMKQWASKILQNNAPQVPGG